MTNLEFETFIRQHNTYNTAVLFCDGSFSPQTKYYGFSVVLFVRGRDIFLYGGGNNEKYRTSMAAELLAVMHGLRELEKIKCRSAFFFTDYKGIFSYILKKDNNDGKKINVINEFKNTYKKISRKIILYQEFIYGHTNIVYHDMADSLASKGRIFAEDTCLQNFVSKYSVYH